MKRPTFIEGLAVAMASSIVGSLLHGALSSVFSEGPALRLLIAGIGLGYVVYLLSLSPERVGRITAVASWGLVAGVILLIEPPLGLYVALHLGLIWLIRSLYFYSSALSALADLGLTGLSLVASLWALSQSGSLFLSLWCFSLVQALFIFIPARLHRQAGPRWSDWHSDDRFDRAHRAAEAAVRTLSSVR